MSDVKWIKITTNIFDDEKILLIESLPEPYAIITVWFKLLCLAGKQNNCGVFMMGNIPYTDKMLAAIFRMKEATVTMALQTFEQFGMVEIVDGVITIPNWEKHQSLSKLEQAREQTRQRVAKYREKQKLLAERNDTSNVIVTQSNADRIREDKDIDIDKDIEKEIERENKSGNAATPSQIVELFNSICISLPTVRTLSETRKKAIKARLNTYTLEDFKQCFENAEKSSFLKGKNERDWTATFDWLIKDTNMAKVLEGNYADKERKTSNAKANEIDEWFEERLRKTYEDPPKTAANDPEIQKMCERLREKIAKGD